LPSDVAEDYREKVRKMLTNLFNQDKNVVINKNRNYQFVFDLNAQFENIALRSLEKFGIKREPIQNLSNNGKIQTGQFIVELAKSLGSLGVRFLQVFGQYFDLPKELQQEFLSVYDNASNLYMANLFQSAETAIDSLQNPANAASQEEMIIIWRKQSNSKNYYPISESLKKLEVDQLIQLI
jgi:HPt (histidine-containing phosphotransfer) domain-containing protein